MMGFRLNLKADQRQRQITLGLDNALSWLSILCVSEGTLRKYGDKRYSEKKCPGPVLHFEEGEVLCCSELEQGNQASVWPILCCLF